MEVRRFDYFANMNTKESLHQLKTVHESFTGATLSLSESEYLSAPPEKWNAGEHLQHLHISLQATLMVMKTPKFISTEPLPRASMSYDQLIAVYLDAIAKGLKAPPNFVPPAADFNQRAATVVSLLHLVEGIASCVESMSETDLDGLTVPHPALKRLTMREMVYFTIYHCIHHHALMNKAVAG